MLGGRGDLPKMIIIVVAIVGTMIVILNITLVICLIRRKRGKRRDDGRILVNTCDLPAGIFILLLLLLINGSHYVPNLAFTSSITSGQESTAATNIRQHVVTTLSAASVRKCYINNELLISLSPNSYFNCI